MVKIYHVVDAAVYDLFVLYIPSTNLFDETRVKPCLCIAFVEATE